VKKPVSFYSEGCRLVGDVYYLDGPGRNVPRAGIVLCHGYTGVKDIYLPDNARVLTEAGYVVSGRPILSHRGRGADPGQQFLKLVARPPPRRYSPWARGCPLLPLAPTGDAWLGAKKSASPSRFEASLGLHQRRTESSHAGRPT